MKYWLTLLLTFSLRLGGACDYTTLTMTQACQRADLIVRARVVALRDSMHYNLYSEPIKPPFTAGNQPVLRIMRVLKGQWAQPELALVRLPPGDMCAPSFMVGQEYVLFLSRWQGGYVASPGFPNFLASDKPARTTLRRLLVAK